MDLLLAPHELVAWAAARRPRRLDPAKQMTLSLLEALVGMDSDVRLYSLCAVTQEARRPLSICSPALVALAVSAYGVPVAALSGPELALGAVGAVASASSRGWFCRPLASFVLARGRLYTLVISLSEARSARARARAGNLTGQIYSIS